MSRDMKHTILLLGDGRGGAVLTAQRPQVHHRPIRCPEKRVGNREAATVGLSGLAHTDDAAGLVDAIGTTGAPAKRPQVHHAAAFGPQERVTASTNDVVPVVDAQRDAHGRPPRPPPPPHAPRTPPPPRPPR